MGKTFFVIVVNEDSPKVMMVDEKMKVIYEKTYPEDVRIVEYDLMHNSQIIVMIIEDIVSLTREITGVSWQTGEYIQAPIAPQPFDTLFCLRSIMNVFLVVGCRSHIYLFSFDTTD